ncbi:MAG: hypothetical protein Phog2KO_05570 [Phototrophicaceae bacterium]
MAINHSNRIIPFMIIVLAPICLSVIFGIPLGNYLFNPNGCQINRLPYIIRSSGYYCLDRDLNAIWGGITVNADNVIIDFNGYSMNGSQNPNNTYYGISAENRSNIQVRNGSITGFLYAINFNDIAYKQGVPYETGWHIIDNMNISYATFRGIVIRGNENLIQNNTIQYIQGNLVYENSFAIGIESTGPNVVIRDNFVYEVRGMGSTDIGEGIGISITDHGDNSTITTNTVINDTIELSPVDKESGLSRSTWAIWVGGESSGMISYNEIDNYMFGIAFTSTTKNSLIHDNIIIHSYAPITLTNTEIYLTYNNNCEFENCLIGLNPIPTREP